MAQFGADASERFIPLPPAVVFAGMEKIIPNRFKMKSSDDFTMSCTFSSGASAFTWGENFNAHVVPTEGGATVKVQGVGKVGMQIMQSARTTKLLNQFFDELIAHLKANRT
jgi:hypothetical protein